MTRFKISLGIVLLLVGASIFSGIWINGRCKSLMELSVRAEELFSQGDSDGAVEVTRTLEKDWEKFRTKAAMLVQNNKLAELDQLCARVRHLAENDSDELLSELSELYHLLDLLRNGEIPKMTSLL